MIEAYSCYFAPGGDLSHVVDALEPGHDVAAVQLLMRAADQHGIDPSVLWSAGVACRDIFSNGIAYGKTANAESDYWPACLGNRLYDLPDQVQRVVQAGTLHL